MTAHRFDAAWRETITLRDGREARLRLVQPDDKPLFERGFERLSPRSRYLRFFGGKNRLSEAELRYLTEMDGENHLAIGAVATGPDGVDEGIGVARFVRFAGEPDVAELAVAVIDDLHGQGLGRALCERIVLAARERGVKRIRAEVLPSNTSALSLLQALVPAAETATGDGAVRIELDIGTPPDAPADSPVMSPGSLIERLFGLVAGGMLILRRVFDEARGSR